MGGTTDIETRRDGAPSGVLDLAAFRAQRSAAPAPAPVAKLRIVGDTIEVDVIEHGVVLVLSAGLAEAVAEKLAGLAVHLRARAELAELQAKREHVPLAGRRGRKLPPLKLRGWAIDTLGGSPTSDDPRWTRMTRAMSRLEAEQSRREYVEYGYAEHRVRVVPVDHRGRVIPPERLPTEAR